MNAVSQKAFSNSGAIVASYPRRLVTGAQRSLIGDAGFAVKWTVAPTELKQRMTNALFFSFWPR
jgi:hypothetical protein